MKKNTAVITISLIAAVTVAMTFIQPTVIHQLVVWVSGLFAVVMALALFAVSNWPQGSVVNNIVDVKMPRPTHTAAHTQDEALILTVRALRKQNFSDWAISRTLKIDIDVIKAIP